MLEPTLQAVSVTDLNTYLKEKLNNDEALRMLCVEGEVSNLTIHTSGHIYFTLKDSKSAIRAVLFKGYRRALRFQPKNGMQVYVVGDVSIYERNGGLQIYVQHMYEAGIGDIHAQFEEQKRVFQEKGLFDDAHKRPIPKFPERLGVITSPTGAAIEDIKNVLRRRYPLADVLLEPVQVQGESAAPGIAAAIRKLDGCGVDTILLARGGGAVEDLAVFNDEAVAYAIYEAETPIITGIGHEIDFTIADFVADMRAPTPSAAAEQAVPDMRELTMALAGLEEKLHAHMEGYLQFILKQLEDAEQLLSSTLSFKELQVRNALAISEERLNSTIKAKFERARSTLASRAAMLEERNPLYILSKGYARVTKESSSVSSTAQLSPGDVVTIQLKDGETPAKILEQNEQSLYPDMFKKGTDR